MASLLRTDKEITEIYHRQIDTVYRICYSFMKNKPEAEDMVQETFLRLIASGKTFENQRHEKAWLIVTASNLCKDQLKRLYRTDEDLDKTAVYLYYYEGYTTREIAGLLHCPQPTVRTRLARARKQLKTMLGGDLE